MVHINQHRPMLSKYVIFSMYILFAASCCACSTSRLCDTVNVEISALYICLRYSRF